MTSGLVRAARMILTTFLIPICISVVPAQPSAERYSCAASFLLFDAARLTQDVASQARTGRSALCSGYFRRGVQHGYASYGMNGFLYAPWHRWTGYPEPVCHGRDNSALSLDPIILHRLTVGAFLNFSEHLVWFSSYTSHQ